MNKYSERELAKMIKKWNRVKKRHFAHRKKPKHKPRKFRKSQDYTSITCTINN